MYVRERKREGGGNGMEDMASWFSFVALSGYRMETILLEFTMCCLWLLALGDIK